MYIYDDDVAPLLPKGTILHFLAWYDNTKNNKSNPDPDQWVGWGDRTVDEMGHAWINITYYNDDEFKAEVAKRTTVNTTADSSSSSRSDSLQRVREAPSEFGRRLLFRLERHEHARTSIRRASDCWSCRRAGGTLVGAGQQGVGQMPSSLPLTSPIRERGSSVTPALRGLVLRQGRQRQRCSSATSTATRSRSSTFRPGRTTASSRAGPIRGSRRISCPGRQWGAVLDQAAEGLRQQEADVDDRRQRPHQHHHAAHAGRLHRRAVRGRGEQEHAADAEVPAPTVQAFTGRAERRSPRNTRRRSARRWRSRCGRPTKARRSTSRSRAGAAAGGAGAATRQAAAGRPYRPIPAAAAAGAHLDDVPRAAAR